jgi:ribosome biogenesis GTPase A
MVIRGGETDTERAANMLLEEYRNCKIGFITLERAESNA